MRDYIRSKINFRFWRPDFTDMRPVIGDIYGKPISIFISQRGQELKLNPLKWYNGHPGEHTIEYKCEPADCVLWTKNQYGVQYGVAVKDGALWAQATTPDGARYSTQSCRLVLITPYGDDAAYA
jgi:hypothetical protein